MADQAITYEKSQAVRARWTAWLASDAACRLLLIVILAIGGYLRLSHVNWDDETHIHPDERFLTMVEDKLKLPTSLGQYFDSTKSPLNPYNVKDANGDMQFPSFVYGDLPMTIVRVVAELANKVNQSAEFWTSAPNVPLDLTVYWGVHYVGRTLSGIFDLGCVWLIFLIGRRLYSRRVGLLAAGLLAFAVLPLQQSHFFTADTFGTFFTVLTFYLAVRVAQGGPAPAAGAVTAWPDEGWRRRPGGGWLAYVALGVSLGAAIACRINLAPLAAIALLAAGIRAWDDWRDRAAAEPEGNFSGLFIQATLFRVFLLVLAAVISFRVTMPYAFGGTSVLDFSLSQHWRDNMDYIQQLIRGDLDSPPGHQWTGRTPFVFLFVNMVVWGLGVPLGAAGWLGWLAAAWQVLRSLTIRGARVALARAHLLPVAWVGGMFLWQGLQYVQSMRYILPIYPLVALLAAWFLWWLVDLAGDRMVVWRSRRAPAAAPAATVTTAPAAPVGVPVAAPGAAAARRTGPLQPWAYALLITVTVATVLWGWGFLAIYRRPLSRVTASRWMYDNIPAGSVIANEHWDDPLPLQIDGKCSFQPCGPFASLTSSPTGLMNMYDEDTPDKRQQLYKWLDQADYIVLSSNRLWASIPRLPLRYPMTTKYYQLLFSGQLGFQQVARFTSFPTIFGLQFDDSGAEEAFSVYDHPVVYIFHKTPAYSEARARSFFDPIDLENTIQYWPKQASKAPTALLLPAADAARQQAGGTWSAIFSTANPLNQSQVLAAVAWLLLVELLAVLALPYLFVALRGLSDRGWAFARIFGMLALAWLSWVGPALKLWPFQRWSIALALLALAAGAAALAWPRRREMLAWARSHRNLLLTEEAIFLALFLVILLARWGNPDLWHPARGGEKPMDFAYLNAVIKSTTFPPYDPWFAGGFINYYYFGFVIIGTLIKLTGIVPEVAYNLAVPTLFALTGLGAFSVAYNLAVPRRRATPDADTPDPAAPRPLVRAGLLAGLAATLFVAVIGNLGEVKLLFDTFAQHSPAQFHSTIPGLAGLLRVISGALAWLGQNQPLAVQNDWWFWNASRIIPDTINEFPFFTFTYADLHAHMIAFPIALLALGTAVALVRDFRVPTAGGTSVWRIALAELWPMLLLGFLIGALRATNTWDYPTYALVALAALAVLEIARRADRPGAGPDPNAIFAPRPSGVVGLVATPPAVVASPMADTPDSLSGAQDWLAFALRAVVSVIWRLLVVLVVGVIAFYPYTRWYATAYSGLQVWPGPNTKLTDYLLVHGIFLAFITIYLLSELAVQIRRRLVPDWLDYMLPLLLSLVILLVGAGWVLHIHVWLLAAPLFMLALVLACGRDLAPTRRLGLLLIALGLAITMGVEIVRLQDDIGRMNTVFKFYLQAWILFGVGAALGLAEWLPRATRWTPGLRRLAVAVCVLLFVGGMLYPPLAARAKVLDRFSAQDQPHTLDGMAYMAQAQYYDNSRNLNLAADEAAIEWMRQNVAGSPVILEGQTPNYRWGSRFSIYTGLPDVMGWDWHEKQQRSIMPGTMVDRRIAQVKELYMTTDLGRTRQLLTLFNVKYIIVGELERTYYAANGLAKFDVMASQGALQVVYASQGVKIYQVQS